MKEISRQSLTKIHDVIHGQNYLNIKARIDQLLPAEYAKLFAGIKLFDTIGVWYGEDAIDYHSHSDASDLEKEEIVMWLEECKEMIPPLLASMMPYANSLFTIPTEEQIYWYKNANGDIRVTLVQWGFESRAKGKSVDVIGMLLSVSRTLAQQDVVVHVDYSDGSIADNVPLILYLFNNVKEDNTDENGNFHLGKLFPNKAFAIENISGTNHYDYVVVRDGCYIAVFDWFTKYSIHVEDTSGNPVPNTEMIVNGLAVTTDEHGYYETELKLLPDMAINVEVKGKSYSFMIQHNPEDNNFVITIEKEKQQSSFTPLPPEVEYIKVTLLDYDGQPLPNLPFVVSTKKEECICGQTNEKGVALIDKKMFSEENKYNIEFTVTSSYREKQLQKKNSNENSNE